jgi:hypothetical protein
MRLPVPAPIESRDGTVEKDGLCKNLLIEQDDEVLLSALRPGLSAAMASSGSGNGITEFNGVLISSFGTSLSLGIPEVSLGTIDADFHDFVQSTI